MKIIIENKKEENDFCVLDAEKAIAIRVEPFERKFRMMTITYEQKFFSYSDKDCNFYTITHTMDGMAHKYKVDVTKIFTDFTFGIK